MSKFKKLCESIINENNEFFNIASAHLEGYPAVTFIDTDKDIGISVHSNKDHFEVISNFNNKKTFTDLEQALQYAKEQGEAQYAVYDYDSRVHFALEDFLKKAGNIISKGELDSTLKYNNNISEK